MLKDILRYVSFRYNADLSCVCVAALLFGGLFQCIAFRGPYRRYGIENTGDIVWQLRRSPTASWLQVYPQPLIISAPLLFARSLAHCQQIQIFISAMDK